MPLSELEGVHAAYCQLAATIAKSNTLIRERWRTSRLQSFTRRKGNMRIGIVDQLVPVPRQR